MSISLARRREEREFHADDRDACVAVLANLGLRPVRTYEKVRSSWRLNDVIVCLDTLPFGAFVEIEFTPAVSEKGEAAALERAVALLGLQEAQRVQASYARLQQEWNGYTLTIQQRSLGLSDEAASAPGSAGTKAKSLLSELAQACRWPLPRYSAEQAGAAHAPTFYAMATLLINGSKVASAPIPGASKKEAEQGAARDLLITLQRLGLAPENGTE